MMKYKAGDKVKHFTGVNGMITNVFLDTNVYWFVYLKGNEIVKLEIDECEIEGYDKDNKFGFNKNRT